MHRIGGLEKADGSGNVSYDPANHELMVRLRAQEGGRVSPMTSRPSSWTTLTAWAGPTSSCLGWGSTYGAIQAAVRAVREAGQAVAHAQLRHLNPFPANLGADRERLRGRARSPRSTSAS